MLRMKKVIESYMIIFLMSLLPSFSLLHGSKNKVLGLGFQAVKMYLGNKFCCCGIDLICNAEPYSQTDGFFKRGSSSTFGCSEANVNSGADKMNYRRGEILSMEYKFELKYWSFTPNSLRIIGAVACGCGGYIFGSGALNIYRIGRSMF